MRKDHKGIYGLASVIMPSYNCEAYIADAIESVLNQSYRNLELIICDDNSGDQTKEIISTYTNKDTRVKAVFNSENKGAALSRNRCTEIARGEYIAFLDADDLWVTNKLDKQIGFMHANNSDFSCTGYYETDEGMKTIVSEVRPYPKVGYWKILFTGNPLGNSTVVYNANNLGKYYAPDIRKRNDFALWLDIARNNVKASGILEPLAIYRRRKDSLSSNKMRLLKHQWNLYRNIEHLALPISFAAMITWFFVKITNLRRKNVK